MRKTIDHKEWLETGARLFGHFDNWIFICPMCKTPQTPKDLLDAGIPKDKINGFLAYSCIGRFVKGKGCDWTLGGLLQLHTLEVVMDDGHKRPVFEFGEAPQLDPLDRMGQDLVDQVVTDLREAEA